MVEALAMQMESHKGEHDPSRDPSLMFPKQNQTSAVSHQAVEELKLLEPPGRTNEEKIPRPSLKTQSNDIKTQFRKQQTVLKVLKYRNYQMLIPRGVEMALQNEGKTNHQENSSDPYLTSSSGKRKMIPDRRKRAGRMATEKQTETKP